MVHKMTCTKCLGIYNLGSNIDMSLSCMLCVSFAQHRYSRGFNIRPVHNTITGPA